MGQMPLRQFPLPGGVGLSSQNNILSQAQAPDKVPQLPALGAQTFNNAGSAPMAPAVNPLLPKSNLRIGSKVGIKSAFY